MFQDTGIQFAFGDYIHLYVSIPSVIIIKTMHIPPLKLVKNVQQIHNENPMWLRTIVVCATD